MLVTGCSILGALDSSGQFVHSKEHFNGESLAVILHWRKEIWTAGISADDFQFAGSSQNNWTARHNRWLERHLKNPKRYYDQWALSIEYGQIINYSISGDSG